MTNSISGSNGFRVVLGNLTGNVLTTGLKIVTLFHRHVPSFRTTRDVSLIQPFIHLVAVVYSIVFYRLNVYFIVYILSIPILTRFGNVDSARSSAKNRYFLINDAGRFCANIQQCTRIVEIFCRIYVNNTIISN